MKQLMTSAAVIAVTAVSANAGGIERGSNGYGILFDQGDKFELGFSSVSPSVSGAYPITLGGGSTGNMAEGYSNLSFSYKNDLTDNFAIALFLNQPYGADANYTSGAYTGLAANWDSEGLSLVGRYRFSPNVSVYGGVRSVRSNANIAIPDLLIRGALGAAGSPLATTAAPGSLSYTGVGEQDTQTSLIAGAAYERPEIALRVALTLETGFTHEFDTTENLAGLGIVNAQGVTEVEMPQAITLDFQTGVNEKTLVFGQIKHAEWSVWEVAPPAYFGTLGQPVTGLDNDVTTFRIGTARRFTDNFVGILRASYEQSNGGVASRLAPTDGSTSIGIAGRYTMDNVTLTGGIEYIEVGDAVDSSGVDFSGNSAFGLGFSIGYSF